VPPFEFDLEIAKEIIPLSLIYVGMLAFNNLCLKYVEVTFYQVARSLSIVFNILFTYVLLGKDTSMNAIVSCLIVFAGFFVGAYGEINFSWEGIFYGVGSSCFVALYGIYVKKKLTILDNNEWRLLHYNTTLAILILLPLVWLSGEMSFLDDPEIHFLGEVSFWNIMTITAVAGFLINIAIFLQIKVTTPLTNTISGTAKVCNTFLCPLPSARSHSLTPSPFTGLCTDPSWVDDLQKRDFNNGKPLVQCPPSV